MVFAPVWTSAMIYVIYNQPNNNVFTTWWYAAVCIFQFLVGVATMYLYCWLKADLEARDREEIIKLEQGKMRFERECSSIVAYPCKCKLWDKDMDTVIKRFDNQHQVDVRANILCPLCKNRIDVIL